MAVICQQQPQKMDVRDFVKAINIRASKAHRSVFRAVISSAAVTDAPGSHTYFSGVPL